MTRAQGIAYWHKRWSQLRAWRRDLSEVKIEVSDRILTARVGTCFSAHRIVIYRGSSFVQELATLLHELAHAATVGRTPHSDCWQETFSSAASEVTGIAVVPVVYNYRVLDRAVEDAIKHWWWMSGEADRWELARKLSRLGASS